MNTLINYYKNLENLLKNTPVRRSARDVRKYFERLKNVHLEVFKDQMVKLRKQLEKAEKARIEEARNAKNKQENFKNKQKNSEKKLKN